MGQPLGIFDGAGAQVNIYDATNGTYKLGYISDEGLDFSQDALKVGISPGQKVQTNDAIKFAIPLMQTDTAGPMATLATRRGTLQEVYIIGMDMAIKISNVLLSMELKRSFKPGEAHKLIVTGETYDTSQIDLMINLLGTDGNMNTDAGGGIATGWANTGCTALSVASSHLSGQGNEQRATMANNTQYMYYNKRFPLDQVPVKITASGYVHNYTVSDRDFYLGFRTLNSSDVVVDSKLELNNIGGSAEARFDYEVSFTPGADIKTIQLVVMGGTLGSISVGFDNMQLEMGELTAFTTG